LFDAVHLGVPAAVATDGAVHLTRRLARSSTAGLVNAVLRRAVPAWSEAMKRAPANVRWSHPDWLIERWEAQFGAAAVARVMAANQEPAPVWVWFVDDRSRTRLESGGVVLDSHPWCPGAWCSPGHARELLAAVENGDAYAQDPSSQLVAHLVQRVSAAGDRLVDLCAAPGGKAALAIKLGEFSDAVAIDLRLQRVRLMVPLLARVGDCTMAAADSTRPPHLDRSFDVVLLDAPCSGTGTLRRHPELRWRLRPGSIAEMATLQRRLLAAGLNLVAGGGVLLYATCSVEPEENERLFDPMPRGFSIVDLGSLLPSGVPWISTDAGGIRILPHVDGDGFTMHAVRRSD
jgi:16S rRNA (cytosine967-C5)-methyltransferase